MSYNLTNEFIDESFQQLAQISGSSLLNGTGSLISNLDLTSSYATNAGLADVATTATNATNATSASHAIQADNATTASYLEGNVTSASYAAQADNATTADFATDVNALYTASIVDANISFLKGGGQTFNITVDNVASSSFSSTAISSSHAIQADNSLEATNASHADTLQFPVVVKEALTKGDPVYISGYNAAKDLPEVKKADASDSSKMPSIGLVQEDAVIGNEKFIINSGDFNDLNTLTGGLVSPSVGDTIYVNVGGGFTNVKPTGSNLIQNVGIIGRVNGSTGEIVVSAIGRSNDVPNIAQGSIWVGDTNGVATATSTGSFAKIDKNNSFTGNQTFNDITVNGTGSFAYIQSVTGSAKIIGDAFIVLNNQTPAERYAGIKVIDSGSTPAVTASLEFDGLNNDWFYEYEKAGDPDNFALIIAGPEYGTKGSPTYLGTNKIQKGTGGHHIGDSNISDDGSQVAVAVNTVVTGSVQASNGFLGDLQGIADNALSANSLAPGNQTISGSLLVSSSKSEGVSKLMLPAISNNTSFDILVGGENFDFRGEVYVPTLSYRKANGTFDNQAISWRLGVEDPNAGYWNRYTIGAWGNTVSFRPSGSDHSSFMSLIATSGNNYSNTLADINADTINIGDNGYTGTINYGGSGTVTNLQGSVNQAKVQLDAPSNNNTASIDMSQSNIFQVFMGNTTNRIELANVVEGQAINIIIEQEGSIGGGTLTFGPNFKFAGGNVPTISPGAGAIDLISGVAVDNGSLFCAASQNLS